MISFGSLFSGIGGFDLGFEAAGMVCKWQVENNPFCIKVLNKHWPDIPKYGDITKLDFTKLERVDVICGGFPCQDVSVANAKRKNIGENPNEKSSLWIEQFRAIREIRPRFAAIENVPGLLSLGFDRVLGDLASLRYDAVWFVIRAAFLGAHFQGDRLFIIAKDQTKGPEIDCSRLKEMYYSHCKRALEERHWSFNDFFRMVQYSIRSERYNDRGLRVPNGCAERFYKDRIRALGNCIVPQQAEIVGRMITSIIEY